MKHKMIILFFMFLVSFVVYKQVTISQYIPILKQRTKEPPEIVVSNSRRTTEPQFFPMLAQKTTDPQDLITVSKNESSRNYISSADSTTPESQMVQNITSNTVTSISSADSKTPEPQMMQNTTSSTVTSISSADSRTPELQVTQYTTSSTVTPSISFHESDFCSDREYEPISEIPSYWINRCPEKLVVTAHQIGRLGNQMWEYASAWTVAKTLDREPFTPTCIIRALGKVFQNLTAIPPLKYIERCPIKFDHMHNMESVEQAKGNVALQWYAQIPQYLVPHLKEVIQLFQFHDHLVEKSQNVLRTASKGVSDIVYVSIHVRRTDYSNHLKSIYNLTMVNGDFFLRQMNYFRNKYSKVIFVIVSDDPDWCDRELSANDTVVVRGNSPEQDLSLLASCNHSIVDYGTFGLWGAMMAGGETVLYKLPSGLEVDLVKLMPKWNLVT